MLRWWDGEQWTDHRTDDPSFTRPPEPPAGSAYTGPTKTSGWAIASVVLGVLGGVIFAILCGVIAKDRIRKAGGRLTGDGLANAGIVLGSIWAVVLVTAFVLSEIETTDNVDKFTGPQREIAQVVDRVERAFEDNGGDEACADLLTTRFAASVSRGSGSSCGEFIDDAIDDGRYQADIRVKRITVTGQTATLDVTEGGDPQTWRMRREAGSWRVDQITSR
jgi:hypothetical protein